MNILLYLFSFYGIYGEKKWIMAVSTGIYYICNSAPFGDPENGKYQTFFPRNKTPLQSGKDFS
ncbi:hypothetical protein [Chryseobacterium sp.]|uniref:hypothetical protein n=1 Tax=Chryseobacterium sp. TaxID=1871047 RepID=UPI002840B744|nr:hypothetical protein [Chryseobacterium sp.]MDR3023888.1 hypothetical protein [Chryseobacterium sp.]